MAFSILAFCGNPKFNHLARTQRPEVVEETAAAFDAATSQVLTSIAKASDETFAAHIADLRMVPRKKGGLGIPLQQPLLRAAYEASRDPSGPDQHSRSQPVIDAAIARLQADPKLSRVLQANKKKNASAGLCAPRQTSTRTCLAVQNSQETTSQHATMRSGTVLPTGVATQHSARS
jgi:hypothetical protein